ncbi:MULTISPECIES: GntR family transcriptional regulator [Erwiniaceae]|uniref:GntR family transcriptional regulator n=1 Tax=Pantoea coffeiphila TaxID=1465635 RepID=A0A2S9I4C1_9GAMM|nr:MULTISPECIES: GntR family transcriptional regulator [Erwiniaceae]MBK0002585.1 GntR family transcriptional regulator [Erwinia sp. S38]MBM7341492.1 DNA-binding GntR family transcriptional regulator [Pantoea coffeiphila]PRD12554.1 GntR family transcriptional regulator [Pantoea coffeiphila]
MASELTRLLPHSVRVYRQLRQEIYEFILMPGDRFTEVDIASRLGCSRTPVREALLTLQNDDLIRRCFRNGWEVCPIDFDVYEDLYATRILIEVDTVARLCSSDSAKTDRSVLARLRALWIIPPEQQEQAGEKIATMDEQFHIALTEAAGNRELTAILSNITDRIRIMRRLDFEYDTRIAQTYAEHAELLEAIENREQERAVGLMREHIEDAHTGACAITLRRLQKVRARNLP